MSKPIGKSTNHPIAKKPTHDPNAKAVEQGAKISAKSNIKNAKKTLRLFMGGEQDHSKKSAPPRPTKQGRKITRKRPPKDKPTYVDKKVLGKDKVVEKKKRRPPPRIDRPPPTTGRPRAKSDAKIHPRHYGLSPKTKKAYDARKKAREKTFKTKRKIPSSAPKEKTKFDLLDRPLHHYLAKTTPKQSPTAKKQPSQRTDAIPKKVRSTQDAKSVERSKKTAPPRPTPQPSPPKRRRPPQQERKEVAKGPSRKATDKPSKRVKERKERLAELTKKVTPRQRRKSIDVSQLASGRKLIRAEHEKKQAELRAKQKKIAAIRRKITPAPTPTMLKTKPAQRRKAPPTPTVSKKVSYSKKKFRKIPMRVLPRITKKVAGGTKHSLSVVRTHEVAHKAIQKKETWKTKLKEELKDIFRKFNVKIAKKINIDKLVSIYRGVDKVRKSLKIGPKKSMDDIGLEKMKAEIAKAKAVPVRSPALPVDESKMDAALTKFNKASDNTQFRKTLDTNKKYQKQAPNTKKQYLEMIHQLDKTQYQIEFAKKAVDHLLEEKVYVGSDPIHAEKWKQRVKELKDLQAIITSIKTSHYSLVTKLSGLKTNEKYEQAFQELTGDKMTQLFEDIAMFQLGYAKVKEHFTGEYANRAKRSVRNLLYKEQEMIESEISKTEKHIERCQNAYDREKKLTAYERHEKARKQIEKELPKLLDNKTKLEQKLKTLDTKDTKTKKPYAKIRKLKEEITEIRKKIADVKSQDKLTTIVGLQKQLESKTNPSEQAKLRAEIKEIKYRIKPENRRLYELEKKLEEAKENLLKQKSKLETVNNVDPMLTELLKSFQDLGIILYNNVESLSKGLASDGERIPNLHRKYSECINQIYKALEGMEQLVKDVGTTTTSFTEMLDVRFKSAEMRGMLKLENLQKTNDKKFKQIKEAQAKYAKKLTTLKEDHAIELCKSTANAKPQLKKKHENKLQALKIECEGPDKIRVTSTQLTEKDDQNGLLKIDKGSYDKNFGKTKNIRHETYTTELQFCNNQKTALDSIDLVLIKIKLEDSNTPKSEKVQLQKKYDDHFVLPPDTKQEDFNKETKRLQNKKKEFEEAFQTLKKDQLKETITTLEKLKTQTSELYTHSSKLTLLFRACSEIPDDPKIPLKKEQLKKSRNLMNFLQAFNSQSMIGLMKAIKNATLKYNHFTEVIKKEKALTGEKEAPRIKGLAELLDISTTINNAIIDGRIDNFSGLLITPIQRLPRYSLLLKDLSKGSSEDAGKLIEPVSDLICMSTSMNNELMNKLGIK